MRRVSELDRMNNTGWIWREINEGGIKHEHDRESEMRSEKTMSQ